MTACLLHYFVIRLSANDEVNGGVALLVNAELVVLAGQDRVYCDADEGCYREAGEGYDADLDAADGVVDADREDEDKSCYGADVLLSLLLPENNAEAFSARVTELSAGACSALAVGEELMPVRIK